MYEYIFTLTKMETCIRGNRIRYIEHVCTFYFTKIGQNTYERLGTILSANELRLLSSHRKGRLVTLTTWINIPSLHGNTSCCTVALAS